VVSVDITGAKKWPGPVVVYVEMYVTALKETRYGSAIVIAVCAVELRELDLPLG